jgi:hypothetical protein
MQPIVIHLILSLIVLEKVYRKIFESIVSRNISAQHITRHAGHPSLNYLLLYNNNSLTKMNWFFTIYVAILFFILTPTILLRLPPKGNKYTVALVHAIVFAIVFHFTYKFVWKRSVGLPMNNNMRMPMKQQQQMPVHQMQQ